MEWTGAIKNLKLQVRYPLEVSGVKLGAYVGDFEYTENGVLTTEDCKGYRTPLYAWKKKHFEAQYKRPLKET